MAKGKELLLKIKERLKNNNKFGMLLKFDCGEDLPRIFIADQNGNGTCYVEIFEDPVWSKQNGDWAPGIFATTLLDLMNREK